MKKTIKKILTVMLAAFVLLSSAVVGASAEVVSEEGGEYAIITADVDFETSVGKIVTYFFRVKSDELITRGRVRLSYTNDALDIVIVRHMKGMELKYTALEDEGMELIDCVFESDEGVDVQRGNQIIQIDLKIKSTQSRIGYISYEMESDGRPTRLKEIEQGIMGARPLQERHPETFPTEEETSTAETESQETKPQITEPENTEPTETEPSQTTKPTETQPTVSATENREETVTVPTASTTVSSVSKGDDFKSVEKAITKMKSEEPKGAKFGTLCAKASTVKTNKIKLKWNKVKYAKKYIIYSNICGKKNKFKKAATLSSSKKSYTAKKAAGKKIKKGKYYKFIVVAVDDKDKVTSISPTIHAATKGGKYGNPNKITSSIKKSSVVIKSGKKLKLKAKAKITTKKMKLKNHRKVKYESTNKTIATVNSKGVISTKKKGTCNIFIYAQNGLYKKIKLKVK